MSTRLRGAALNYVKKQYFDLVVIGGGITGAGIALDAASRGLKTLLLEKQDFAAGTSSRSTKLIHGGLRYLKQLEIGLVREVGKERAILHKNVPHLVHPKQMLLPIRDQGTLSENSTSVALYIYDWLAGVKSEERRVMLDPEEMLEKEPLLREEGLHGGGMYYEYMTDDARLTIEVLKTACSHGAQPLNYAEVTDYLYDVHDKAIGVKVRDRLSGEEMPVYGKVMVNAAGPWVDRLREKDDSMTDRHLLLTKGVHLVFERDRFPINHLIYFDVQEDDRMLFAIPRGNCVYLGTTDTVYEAKIDRPGVDSDDIEYLLGAANFMFPELGLTKEDIISSWAGLRPLIHEEGKSPSEISRKDEIFDADSGVISIAGGKLTGFRKMAERVVDLAMVRLRKEYGMPIRLCCTDSIKLSGSETLKRKKVAKYIGSLFEAHESLGISQSQIEDLVYRYGLNAERVISIYKNIQPGNKGLAQTLLKSELLYCIDNELVATLSDFLIRRTGRLYFDRPLLAKQYPFLLDGIAAELGWDSAQKLSDLEEFEKEYQAVLRFSEVEQQV